MLQIILCTLSIIPNVAHLQHGRVLHMSLHAGSNYHFQLLPIQFRFSQQES
jgi:hypothetical protein